MSKSTNPHILKSTTPEAEVLVRVEGVSKKFCKDLKRSLWYGIQDITSELFGLKKKEGLRKDEFWAVSDVSFELKRGECLGLIGHNGAGKSTLLKMLNGLINPDKGKISMKGRIGALIELGAGFNPILTGRENVFNNGAVLGFTQEEIAKKYQAMVEFAELEEFMDTPVQNYSSGMKVRLGFAVAAQMEPDVLIIDEVLAVGDVGFKIKCFNIITKLVNSSAVVFVSHSMPQISRICNTLLMLDQGVIVYSGSRLDKGIDKYYSSFSEEKPQQEIADDKLRIRNIEYFVNSTIQKDLIIINNGDDLNINFQLETIEHLNSIKATYVVSDQDLKQLIVVRTEEISGNFKGDFSISSRIPRIPLTMGNYYLSISFIEVINNMQFVLAHYKNIMKIKVFHEGGIVTAPILMNSTLNVM